MAATLLVAVALAAAPFEGMLVAPQVVELSAGNRSADLVVTNVGTGPREVSATALSWSQEEDGAVTLAPADDVGMFPPEAVLAPGEQRRFRLTSWGSPREQEAAYRIALRILDVQSGEAVTALIPAFAAPERVVVSTGVRVQCARPERCRVGVVNQGNVRIRPERIVVAAPREDGTTWESELEPWWVLAGGARDWDVKVPPGVEARDVVVRVSVGIGELTASAAGPHL